MTHFPRVGLSAAGLGGEAISVRCWKGPPHPIFLRASLNPFIHKSFPSLKHLPLDRPATTHRPHHPSEVLPGITAFSGNISIHFWNATSSVRSAAPHCNPTHLLRVCMMQSDAHSIWQSVEKSPTKAWVSCRVVLTSLTMEMFMWNRFMGNYWHVGRAVAFRDMSSQWVETWCMLEIWSPHWGVEGTWRWSFAEEVIRSTYACSCMGDCAYVSMQAYGCQRSPSCCNMKSLTRDQHLTLGLPRLQNQEPSITNCPNSGSRNKTLFLIL